MKDLCVYWVDAMEMTIEQKDKDYMCDWRYENKAKSANANANLNLNAVDKGETPNFLFRMCSYNIYRKPETECNQGPCDPVDKRSIGYRRRETGRNGERRREALWHCV